MPYTKGASNTSGVPYAGAGSTATNQQANNWETQYDEATQSFERNLFPPFVLAGGVGTIHGGLPKQMDVTACTYYPVQVSDGTLRKRVVNATNFTTVTASTTYFLDYNSDGTTSWATTHSTDPNYMAIASVTTDGSGNIAVITDARNTTINLFTAAVGLLQFDSQFVARFGTGGQKAPVNATIGSTLPTTGMVKGDYHILTSFTLP